MGLTRAALVVLATLAVGCSTMTAIDAGPTLAFPTKREPQVGAQVEAHAGVGWSNRDALDTWGLDWSGKLKATAASQNVAFGEGFYFSRAAKDGDVMGMMRGGLHLVFERYEDKLLLGGGPYGAITVGMVLTSREYESPGIMINELRRDRMFLTAGPAIELDARFSRPSAVTFFGLAIGLAWADENLQNRLHRPRLKPEDPANTPPPY